MQMKKAHPTKIVAMQVGDFFELTGWDAVLAIEAIGLNGMGLGARVSLHCGSWLRLYVVGHLLATLQACVRKREPRAGKLEQTAAATDVDAGSAAHKTRTYARFSDKVPRAGFHLRTGRADVARLCQAGHEVLIVLQRPSATPGATVQRYVAQICTPHSPYCELPGTDSGMPVTTFDDRPVWGAAPLRFVLHTQTRLPRVAHYTHLVACVLLWCLLACSARCRALCRARAVGGRAGALGAAHVGPLDAHARLARRRAARRHPGAPRRVAPPRPLARPPHLHLYRTRPASAPERRRAGFSAPFGPRALRCRRARSAWGASAPLPGRAACPA